MQTQCLKIKTAAKWIAPLGFFLISAAGPVRAADQTKTDVEERLQNAATTLRQIADAPDKGIPEEVYASAKCVAVVPNLVKGGFIVAGQHGRGVATCRLPNRSWSAPEFFSISGGTWGAQIGVEGVDLVIMVMNDEGMRHMLSDKFQIGASASASAGPVGRHASADTDWKAETEMLTYSRSKGLFAGIDLGGSWVEPDKDAIAAIYGRTYTNRQLLTGTVTPPPSTEAFLEEVSRVKAESREEHKKS